MNSSNAKNALKTYGKVSTHSGAAYASPHRLILMLVDGALDKISNAKGHMSRGNIKEKGNFISWAISIVGGLRASLDFEKGGEIAGNLEALYDYMERTLVLANVENSIEKLDEISVLLNTIKDAWTQIADTAVEPTADVPAAALSDDGTPGITDKV